MRRVVQLQQGAMADVGRQGVACLCAGVTHAEVDAAIAGDPHATVKSLGEELGCGLQCGSCTPALKEALGELAWFAATVSARVITQPAPGEHGDDRLIYRVELALCEEGPYPQVLPGQHVVVRANTGEALVERTYTVVAQDLQARALTLAVRRKPEGRLTPWLLQPPGPGGPRQIEVSLPGGPGLHPGGRRRPVVFFAGGVGITPAVAMVQAMAPASRLHLHYSVTHRGDAAFLPQFDARSRDRPHFSYQLHDAAAAGRVTEQAVRDAACSTDAMFFICGPEGYARFVRRALRRGGIPADRIHVELFALATSRPAARPVRLRAYVAGALLAIVPLFVLSPRLEAVRPHGHPNVGHAQLKCVACHADTGASMRQTLQAKVKHAFGLRETGAVLGMQPVASASCVQCHANPDDRHPPHRFLEPRFELARVETGAHQCVSCHREHSGVRVTAPRATYCVSCHQDMVVSDDKASPTHALLVLHKRWDTCLQCHDYHGNHRFDAPLRLVDAPALHLLHKYLRDGASPYGETLVKAREEPVR